MDMTIVSWGKAWLWKLSEKLFSGKFINQRLGKVSMCLLDFPSTKSSTVTESPFVARSRLRA